MFPIECCPSSSNTRLFPLERSGQGGSCLDNLGNLSRDSGCSRYGTQMQDVPLWVKTQIGAIVRLQDEKDRLREAIFYGVLGLFDEWGYPFFCLQISIRQMNNFTKIPKAEGHPFQNHRLFGFFRARFVRSNSGALSSTFAKTRPFSPLRFDGFPFEIDPTGRFFPFF